MRAAPDDLILSTKLYIPKPRPNRVPRARLLDRLREAMDYPCTLICAPVGYGKTTLLSEWIPRSEHCVTWVSLDEGDNDPRRFWRHYLAALQTLDPRLGDNARLLLQGSPAPQVEAVLSSLINELAALEFRFAHIFDDYHLVQNPAVDGQLTFLIEHLPPNVNLVIASRSDPALPLARWRARRQLAEVRSEDLRFTLEEAAAFLNRVMMLELSDEDIAALENRTEGWISGLQLAALSVRDRADPARFIAAFAGSHRFIIDYLAEEVLSRQSSAVRQFLLSTSILDRLCGPLCDFVTGGSDSQAILEGLEQSNLFIVPLDDERGWYRYHQLFQEVLRSRLQAGDDRQAPALHVRAAAWFEANGLNVEAIQHALAAKDWERAVRLIMDMAGSLAFAQGQLNTVLAWLQALPVEVIRAHPRLSLVRAWMLLTAGSMEAVDEHLAAAEEAFPALEPVQQPPLQGEIAALKALAASYRREIARTIELCRQARGQLAESNSFLRAAVANALGLAYRFSGRAVEACEAFAEAISLGQASGNYYIMMDSVAGLARMQTWRGQLRAAEQTCRQALRFAEEQASATGQPLFDAGFPYIRLGEVLREWNDLDAAERAMLKGIELGKLGGNLDIVVSGHGFLAKVKEAQGDLAGARAAAQTVEALAVSFGNRLMLAEVAARSARLALAQGDIAVAENWSRQYEALTDTDPAYLDEYARITLARLRLAQSWYPEALDLLKQLRADAEAAERLGSVIELLVLETLAWAAQGDQPQAFAALERALTLAEPEGFVRLFVDEGEAMHGVISEWCLETSRNAHLTEPQQRLLACADRLLEAFPAGPSVRPVSPAPDSGVPLAEPLRDRELEVLRLIAQGYSNHEIADRLVLGLSTVKTHVNNLFRKLDVTSRTQALARARELGLLGS